MVNPSRKKNLKRKRVEKQTSNVTIREGEQHVNQESTAMALEKGEVDADNGLTDTPLVHSPPTVRSRAIFILDNASLKKGLVRKEWKILSSNEDAQFLLKQKKNLNDYRPDIVHGALLSILGSPLNKAGMVAAIYVKTDEGVLFEIKPHVRIPRTCKRFCGVIMKLLQKSSVCAKDTNEVLLRVLKEPVTHHLPVNSHIVGLSYSSEKLVDIEDYVSVMSDAVSPVYVVGAMVNGNVKNDYMQDYISVSGYPLAAGYCVAMICAALEKKWEVRFTLHSFSASLIVNNSSALVHPLHSTTLRSLFTKTRRTDRRNRRRLVATTKPSPSSLLVHPSPLSSLVHPSPLSSPPRTPPRNRRRRLVHHKASRPHPNSQTPKVKPIETFTPRPCTC